MNGRLHIALPARAKAQTLKEYGDKVVFHSEKLEPEKIGEAMLIRPSS